MTVANLALVETATQLLNAAEWAHAAGETATTRIVVLAPTDRHSVRQLAAVTDVLAGVGVDIRSYPVRTARPAALAAAARTMADVAGAPRLIVGDPFSRYIQTLLPLSRAEQIVIVDDGTSTWEYAACVNAGQPLVRWQRPRSAREPRAARATRLLSPNGYREIAVFSCLRDSTPVGAVPLANRYSWTRAWRRPELKDEVDVLGTSLISSGVVQRRPYLDAVADLARRHGPVRYLAHRRESDNLVAEIAAIPNLRVVRPDLPVELALRAGPLARRVIAFPSTAAHTLPVVLGGLQTRVTVRPVEPEWFAPATTRHARRFVARIAEHAPARRHTEIAEPA
jgi:hypothetical protein